MPPASPDTPLPTPETKTSTEHYFLDPQIRVEIAQHWPDLLPKLDTATVPEPSPNPSEMEAWENEHRHQRTQELLAFKDSSGGSALLALEALLYEECFGVNAHPDQGVDWWENDSGAPTPGGELSHSYPMMVVDGVRLEDCVALPFTGNTAKEMITSLKSPSDKEKLAKMIGQLAYPYSMGYDMARGVRGKIINALTYSQDIKFGINTVETIATRYLNLAKTEDLATPITDTYIHDLLGFREDTHPDKMHVWNLLWKRFSKSLVSNSGSYKDPSDPKVIENIGHLLRVRLSPDFQGLFKHSSLSAYKTKGVIP